MKFCESRFFVCSSSSIKNLSRSSEFNFSINLSKSFFSNGVSNLTLLIDGNNEITSTNFKRFGKSNLLSIINEFNLELLVFGDLFCLIISSKKMVKLSLLKFEILIEKSLGIKSLSPAKTCLIIAFS